MDEDNENCEIIASNLDIFGQNDNEILQNDDRSENFIGIGEDPNLEQNFITSSVKKIRKPDIDNTEACFDPKGPPEAQYLCKVVHKLVTENYSPFKNSDFQDRESILNALNSVLLSISRDDLLEWMENSSHFMGFAENFSDITNNKTTNYRTTSSPKESLDSSLGVLSDLSSFSSNEAVKCERSGAYDLNDTKPTYDYLSEIEDLQHKIKGLNEEKAHLTRQMAQTEEINTNLFYENQDLERKQQNLQGILEKMREAEKEYARLKLTLSNYEDTNHNLQEKLTAQHRERLSLEARIRDLNDEITLVNQELDGVRTQVDELNLALNETRGQLNYMKDANDLLSHELEEKSLALNEKERLLAQLSMSNEYLKAQKTDLEVQLCRAEEEIATLQNATHRAQIIPENEIENPTFSCSCNNDSTSPSTISVTSELKSPVRHLFDDHDVTSTSDDVTKAIMPLSPIRKQNCVAASTPSRVEPPVLVKIPSLCAEMRDMLRSTGEPLPSPFCGKHILPAALYRERSLDSFDETDMPKSKIRKLELDSSEIEVSFDDIVTKGVKFDFNLPKCNCSSSAGNVILQDNFISMAKSLSSQDFLNLLQRILQDLTSFLTSINADTTASENQPQTEQSTCIINEPPPATANVNTQGGVDESVKEQINVLRTQIAKTQAILSYLSRGQKLPAGIASLNSFIIEKDSKHRDKSDFSGSFNRLSGDLLTRSEIGHKKGLWAREHVRNPSYSPSQKSTPLHRSRWLTKSCPNLPSYWTVINRSTQTENSQMASESTFPRTPTSDLVVPKTPTTPPKISPNEKSETVDEVDSPPTNREDILSITVSPLALRNRSLSYVTAIKKGNWDDPQSNLLSAQDVVIVHDKTPEFTSSTSEDDNKNRKDGLSSSIEDEIDAHLNENRITPKSVDPDLECEAAQLTDISNNLSEKAKKRRRSFSEHNSSYSGTIDLEEHEADLSRTGQMQGPFLPPTSQGLNDSPPLPMNKITTEMPASLSPPSLDVSVVKFPKASAAFTARVALSDKPKRLGRNPRFLMPDVMETSETESAKDSANGSMESETTEQVTSTTTVLTTATTAVTITTVASAITTSSTVEVIKPPPPSSEPYFPSLPDDFLKKLNLEKSSLLNTEEMTSQEVESKFGTLSLAFKTDKFTLSKRLELQKRQRDMAEGNIDKEVTAMREALNSLNHMCTDSQMRDLIVKVQHHIDIVHQSTSRMSSRAEVYGAVQQEERMSHAYEIMVTYVENLKRLYQKEHHELEDTRRVLIENRLLPENNPTTGSGQGGPGDLFGSSSDDPKRPTRTSIASGSYKPQQTQQTSARRRASVAVFHRPILEAAKSCIGTLSNFGASASNGEFRARLYSAVTPSISPAKLERLNAVSITTTGGTASSGTPSPPITPSSTSATNQRFPFPNVVVAPPPSTSNGGHLRKLAIGSTATGPLNSQTGNEELLAALERVEKVEDTKPNESQSTETSEEKSKESNNNEELTKVEQQQPQQQQVEQHRRLVSSMKRSTSKDESCRDPSPPPATGNDTSQQQTTRSAFNPYPYYRQLSRILFRDDPIRQAHWLTNWLPDDGWWSHWNFHTISRNLRFSLSAILLLGALLSIIFTFFPKQTTACGSSAGYVSRSVEEFFVNLISPYVTVHNKNRPV